MNISEYNIDFWCRRATAQIRYGPDRLEVHEELRSHLEDRRDALMERGLDEKAATDKALESMGAPQDIAPLLAQLHSPFWGYMLRACKIALVLLLILSMVPIWKYFRGLSLQDAPDQRDFAVYDSASYGSGTGRTLLHLSQPGTSFASDGNTFTLTDAALFTVIKDDGSSTAPQMYFLVRQTSPIPWTVHAQYNGFKPVGSSFFARDSLGNVYEGFLDRPQQGAHLMYFDDAQSDLCANTYEFWINDFPMDAQWVELCYERDGRSFSLRVDLTGGDST